MDIKLFLQSLLRAQRSTASFLPFCWQTDTQAQSRLLNANINISLNTALRFFSLLNSQTNIQPLVSSGECRQAWEARLSLLLAVGCAAPVVGRGFPTPWGSGMCSRTYKAAACSQSTVRSYFQCGGTCHLCMSLLTDNKVSEQGPRSLLLLLLPTPHRPLEVWQGAQGPMLCFITGSAT